MTSSRRFGRLERRVTLNYADDSTTTTPKVDGTTTKKKSRKSRGKLLLDALVGLTISVPNCICDRQKRIVMCTDCGYHMKGRIRKACPSHPNTIYLMDLNQCGSCLSPSSALREYSFEGVVYN